MTTRPDARERPAGRYAAAVRDLHPGYFAFVMATGIISSATYLLGPSWLSRTLLAVAAAGLVVLAVALAARLVLFRSRVVADFRAPERVFGFFTITAGLDVLGARLALAGHPLVTTILAIVAAAIWLALTYGVPASLLLTRVSDSVLGGVNGSWLLWIVATQSLSITAATLVPTWPSQAALLAPAAVGLWCVGLLLYLMVVALILLRWLTIPMTPATLGPPYWILMGATAISVLAGASDLTLPKTIPVIAGTASFTEGFTFALWAFGTWWIPLLVILGLWRHLRRHWPLTYEPTLWSVVFPLGMYSVATLVFGRTARLAFMRPIAHVMLWVAVAAWVLVAAAFFTRLARALMPADRPGRADQDGRAARRRPRITRHAVGGAVVSAYLLAAAVVVIAHGVVAVPEWLALHLLVLGAATNAVFTWSRFFAQALLHARPGSEWPAQLRLGMLNAGVAAVLAGVCGSVPPLAVAGAAMVVTAVAAHAASLLVMIRSSPLAGPLGIVAWYYVAACAALAVGGILGGVLAAGWAGSSRLAGAFLLAHAQLNLLGWIGLAIIGTQFMLWPMVLRTRMREDAPRAARRALVLTAGGLTVSTAALLAAPWLGGARWLAATGTACYLAGLITSLVPAAGELRAKAPRTAAAWALLAGNGWLAAALAADTAGLAVGPATADQVLGRILIPVLGIGVTWQVLAGALTFLLPVTLGGGPGGNRRLAAILERGWRLRAMLGNAGVFGLATLPGGWPRVAAWAAVLAGFGTFPVLAMATVAAGWARAAGTGPVRSAPAQSAERPGAGPPGT